MEPEHEVEVEVNQDEHEADTTNESEAEAEDGSEDDGSTDESRTYTQDELDEKLAEKEKRWKDRLKESKKGSKEGTQEVDERYSRLELKSEGIKDKKQQDAVLNYISEKKLLGEDVDIDTALQSTALKEKLDGMKAKASVPPPSTRTSNGTNDSIEYWVAQTKKGNFPTDPAIRKQLRKMNVFG